MKKILSVFLSISMLFILLCAPVSADKAINAKEGEQVVTFSEDLSILYANGAAYHRYNTGLLEDAYNYTTYKADLRSIKDPTIVRVDVDCYEGDMQFSAVFTYEDNATFYCGYLRSDLIAPYEKALENEEAPHFISLGYPNDNNIEVSLKSLKSAKAIQVDHELLSYCEYFNVAIEEPFKINKGLILMDGSKDFYYADFLENKLYDPYLYPGDYDSMIVHPIKDEATIKQLEDAYRIYNGGITIISETFTENIGIFFLVFFFGFLPFGMAVLGFILLLKSKKNVYKKINLIMMLFGLAALICFIILFIMLL